MTATTKGRGSTPNSCASEIATGVTTTATALFETNSVRHEAIRNTIHKTTCGGSAISQGTSASTISCTAPVCSSVSPMASIAKIRVSSRTSTNWKASSASMQRVSKTNATPITARVAIGASPSAPPITTRPKAPKTKGARVRR